MASYERKGSRKQTRGDDPNWRRPTRNSTEWGNDSTPTPPPSLACSPGTASVPQSPDGLPLTRQRSGPATYIRQNTWTGSIPPAHNSANGHSFTNSSPSFSPPQRWGTMPLPPPALNAALSTYNGSFGTDPLPKFERLHVRTATLPNIPGGTKAVKILPDVERVDSDTIRFSSGMSQYEGLSVHILPTAPSSSTRNEKAAPRTGAACKGDFVQLDATPDRHVRVCKTPEEVKVPFSTLGGLDAAIEAHGRAKVHGVLRGSSGASFSGRYRPSLSPNEEVKSFTQTDAETLSPLTDLLPPELLRQEAQRRPNRCFALLEPPIGLSHLNCMFSGTSTTFLLMQHQGIIFMASPFTLSEAIAAKNPRGERKALSRSVSGTPEQTEECAISPILDDSSTDVADYELAESWSGRLFYDRVTHALDGESEKWQEGDLEELLARTDRSVANAMRAVYLPPGCSSPINLSPPVPTSPITEEASNVVSDDDHSWDDDTTYVAPSDPLSTAMKGDAAAGAQSATGLPTEGANVPSPLEKSTPRMDVVIPHDDGGGIAVLYPSRLWACRDPSKPLEDPENRVHARCFVKFKYPLRQGAVLPPHKALRAYQFLTLKACNHIFFGLRDEEDGGVDEVQLVDKNRLLLASLRQSYIRANWQCVQALLEFLAERVFDHPEDTVLEMRQETRAVKGQGMSQFRVRVCNLLQEEKAAELQNMVHTHMRSDRAVQSAETLTTDSG